MAMINTLRNKMGKIVVGFVAVAIISFTLNDILGSNSVFLGENVVGEISGQKITLEEYQSSMDFQERNFTVYTNRQPTESDRSVINDRAWLWLLSQYAYGEQYKELGVDVGADELWDLLQGSNVDPTIRAFFSNQNGEFDRSLFEDFYKNRNNPQYAQSKYVWDAVYPTLKPSRERVKYENLLIKSTYVTQTEGMSDYHSQTDVAEAKYLFIPFYSLSDSTVDDKVTDQMIRAKYNKNKEKYKVDEQRSLKYVSFPILPSAEDTVEIRQEMQDLKSEFTNVDNDELFASANTDGQTAFGRYHYGTIPYQLGDQLESLSKGDIIGPNREGGIFTLFKVSDVYEDTVEYAKASHILITWDDESDEAKAEARTEANRILGEIKNGGNLALLARQYSKDQGSGQQGGDLGWFDSNTMVDEFSTAVFNAPGTGLIPNLVETQFGYHIIEVTESKTNQMYAIATIERFITPSDRTVDDAYRKADLFQSSVSNVSEFETMAEQEGYEVLEEGEILAMDRAVGNLGTSARVMVQWLYRDAKVGKVSDIFDVNESYVVAIMTDKTDEGYKSFDDVKELIRTEVIRDLKADYIKSKLTNLEASLDDIASAYGEDASVYESNDLKLSSNSLPNVGFDPLAVGRIFSLQSGQTSAPFATENGVIIAQMVNLTKAPEVADYSSFSESVRTVRANNTSQKVSSLIEREANIEDKRYKVY